MRKSKAGKRVSLEEIEEQQSSRKKDTGIKELLEKLEIGKKVVLSLYYFEQLTIPEISIALRIPKGTVKSRLHNARKELKKLYQKDFKE